MYIKTNVEFTDEFDKCVSDLSIDQKYIDELKSAIEWYIEVNPLLGVPVENYYAWCLYNRFEKVNNLIVYYTTDFNKTFVFGLDKSTNEEMNKHEINSKQLSIKELLDLNDDNLEL